MEHLRTLVSGSRNRFIDGKYNLDLTYITDRVIAMSFPSSGIESTYRNNIDEVAEMLKEYHGSNYMIFNLSGRNYNYDKFDNQVLEFGFPDHHSPPIPILCQVCQSIDSWLTVNPDHVAVVHCVAGKGRTGCVISCYLIYSGHFPPTEEGANSSLEHFASRRTTDMNGVQYPAQIRYVRYFAKIVEQALNQTESSQKKILQLPPKQLVFISHIVMHGIPSFARDGSCTPAIQVRSTFYKELYNVFRFLNIVFVKSMGSKSDSKILSAPSQWDQEALIYNSAWERPISQKFTPQDEEIVFHVNKLVVDDVFIKCTHSESARSASLLIFRTCFHTSFLEFEENGTGVLRLGKMDLDTAFRDDRVPSSFFVDIMIVRHEEIVALDQNIFELTLENKIKSISRGTTWADEIPNETSDEQEASQEEKCDEFLLTAKESADNVVESKIDRLSSNPDKIVGYMWKQGGRIKNWKKRWFVLHQNAISYFETPTSTKPLGVIPLRHDSLISPIHPDQVHGRERCFSIVQSDENDRIYFLQTESDQEFNRWIEAIYHSISTVDINEQIYNKKRWSLFSSDSTNSSRERHDSIH